MERNRVRSALLSPCAELPLAKAQAATASKAQSAIFRIARSIVSPLECKRLRVGPDMLGRFGLAGQTWQKTFCGRWNSFSFALTSGSPLQLSCLYHGRNYATLLFPFRTS